LKDFHIIRRHIELKAQLILIIANDLGLLGKRFRGHSTFRRHFSILLVIDLAFLDSTSCGHLSTLEVIEVKTTLSTLFGIFHAWYPTSVDGGIFCDSSSSINASDNHEGNNATLLNVTVFQLQ
jgi:hypothetical protein